MEMIFEITSIVTSLTSILCFISRKSKLRGERWYTCATTLGLFTMAILSVLVGRNALAIFCAIMTGLWVPTCWEEEEKGTGAQV